MLVALEEAGRRDVARFARRTMYHTEPTAETAAHNLLEAIEQTSAEAAKIEFWASALKGFAVPVPDYEPGNWAYAYVDFRPSSMPAAARAKSGYHWKSG
jgi:hypothetical protein